MRVARLYIIGARVQSSKTRPLGNLNPLKREERIILLQNETHSPLQDSKYSCKSSFGV